MTTRREFVAHSAAALIVAALPKLTLTAEPAPKHTLKTYRIPQTDLVVSRIAYGCANLGGWGKEPLKDDTIAKATQLIRLAYDQGITFFDHADIYGGGKAESAFGAILKKSPGLRDKIVIQSKCGVHNRENPPQGVPGSYHDVSREHILKSVEGSLKRLGTDRLDILLLHWPDVLAEPEEVAAAFDELKRSGKVRYFGVSNHSIQQTELLKATLRVPLVANQIRLGIAAPRPLEKSGLVDYCHRNHIQVQAYSPLRGGILNPAADASPAVKQTAQVLVDLAKQKNAAPSAVALAWLLRHPSGIVPILGATKTEHLIENCTADAVELSRDEWYVLYAAAEKMAAKKS